MRVWKKLKYDVIVRPIGYSKDFIVDEDYFVTFI